MRTSQDCLTILAGRKVNNKPERARERERALSSLRSPSVCRCRLRWRLCLSMSVAAWYQDQALTTYSTCKARVTGRTGLSFGRERERERERESERAIYIQQQRERARERERERERASARRRDGKSVAYAAFLATLLEGGRASCHAKAS